MRAQDADAIVGVVNELTGTVGKNCVWNEPGVYVLLVAAIDADEVRRRFCQSSADGAVELVAVIGRNIRSERIAGVEGVVIALNIKLAMQLIGSRLGKDLGAPVTKAIVLGGEWVLIDANREDGGLRVGSSRVDLQACKLEYSIVSPK